MFASLLGLESFLWLESFLLDYHMGHAVVLLFLLSVAAVVPFQSKRLIVLVLLVFGVVFFVLPSQAVPEIYRFVGIVLVMVTPIIWTTTDWS